MEKMNQLICFVVFVVLMSTSCMAWTIENEAEVDDRLFQLRAATFINGCTQATITPAACGSSCTLTFYRSSNGTHGIALGGSGGVFGAYGFTSLPTSVHFDYSRINTNGSALTGSGFFLYLPIVTITGVTSAKVFTTSSATINHTIPIVITGGIAARSAITFGVIYSSGINSVAIAEIIANAGVGVTIGRPGNGAVTVNLCAPK
jgi:hypothetical protein